jgi:hypothetical protein
MQGDFGHNQETQAYACPALILDGAIAEDTLDLSNSMKEILLTLSIEKLHIAPATLYDQVRDSLLLAHANYDLQLLSREKSLNLIRNHRRDEGAGE